MGMTGLITRRVFLKGVAATVVTAGAAVAQSRVARVGLVVTTTPEAELAGPDPVHTLTRAFLHALRDLGYREPASLVLRRRSAEGNFDRFRPILVELLREGVDVLVTVGNPMTRIAKDLTHTTPIVMATSASPVEAGLVASLARPGGNVTGVTIDTGPELESKRIEYLHAALPRVRRVAFLAMRVEWEGPWGENARAAAATLGFSLALAEHTPTDYSAAFGSIGRERPDALFVSGGPHSSPPNWANRKLILDFAARARLPVIGPVREFTEDGALLSYGVNVPALFSKAAHFVDKILKGARPRNLPVEQATRYELVVNAGTARRLGVGLSTALLVRADEVLR
jgi:putative ABC transport system substrate-binding protein